MNQFGSNEDGIWAYEKKVKRIWDNSAVFNINSKKPKLEVQDRIEIAKKMLDMNIGINTISAANGLTKGEISKIKV